MTKVIGHLASRTFRVLWLLEELGLPYEHQPEHSRSQAVTALNPSGKIPVVIEEGVTLTDSTAIMQYFADREGRFTAPAGTIARAQQDGVLHQIIDEIDAVLWTAARHSFVLPEDKRVREVKDSLKWEYERNLAHLMTKMQGAFLMGDEMTIPDIILAHCGNWAFASKFPTDNEDFGAYLKRMRSRDAFRKLAAQMK
ncbi:glutathione S-transferase family protein [Mesobacterium pallidum]|uniref:glutathione S-transferase family protein n=1 Tax=Mesobacterium pallidum TaxID=2872037 RepID=UPI001EE30EB1|nr:glutathione S-transferase family protein [Mesobacterium pallidum]